MPVVFDDDDEVVYDSEWELCRVWWVGRRDQEFWDYDDCPAEQEWYVMRRDGHYRIERFEHEPMHCALEGDGPLESHPVADLVDALQRLQHEATGARLRIEGYRDRGELLDALVRTPADSVFVDGIEYRRFMLPDACTCFLPHPSAIDDVADELARRDVRWDGPGPVSSDREALYWLNGLCFLRTYNDRGGVQYTPIGRFPTRREALLEARSWCELIRIDDDGNVIEAEDDGYLGEVTTDEVVGPIFGVIRDAAQSGPDPDHEPDPDDETE